MSLFGECTLKNLTAEYVEEQMALKEAKDVSAGEDIEPVEEVKDVSAGEDEISVDEAAYIDFLLEALD